jgi:3',5'-cyclic AMP phosphodiesterase CpdA
MAEFNRRNLLKCMAYGGAGTVFALSSGVLKPFNIAEAATQLAGATPLFVQISDTHIGFNKDANPDVASTLKQTLALIGAMPVRPQLTLHTGDITHLSKAAEFDAAAQLMPSLGAGEVHTVPGEHDVTDGVGTEYFNRFGAKSNNKGYYSFNQSGVHFVALNNVMSFKPGGLGSLGPDQLAWLEQDLKAQRSSTPIVVFAHIPLWNIYEPWGWGTGDGAQAVQLLRRFGSVTILNGHIHQIVSKVEGNITFHTARSTAYPQPAAGVGPGPGPLKVPSDQLPHMLGLTSVSIRPEIGPATLSDTTLS